MKRIQHQAILFDMLRSFTTFACTRNLSETVRRLRTTRQTVRRHIDTLETMRGEKLLNLVDGKYQLTLAGAQSLKEAESVLARADAWMRRHSKKHNGLDSICYEAPPDYAFYAQQHPLNRIWRDDSELMQYGFQCWANARTKLEDPKLQPIRPYLVVYRRYNDDWICVEVGEKSSYATWFGADYAKSSRGRPVMETPAGTTFANLIAQAYEEVYDTGSVRLDHIHTQIPRKKGGAPQPISFQRILFGSIFPDGDFALLILVNRTYALNIDGVSENQIKTMPDDLIMNFEL